MRTLDHTLLTPRLRLEPVTPRIAAAAREGAAAFALAIGADMPVDWGAGSLSLIGRSAPRPLARWGADPAPVRAVAIHREDGFVVGDVRFEPAARDPFDIEIGYSVAAGRRRQGYAVEATGAVIDWLFEDITIERAIAGCDRQNRASIGTLRKLGFYLDGASGSAFWWLITPGFRKAQIEKLAGK